MTESAFTNLVERVLDGRDDDDKERLRGDRGENDADLSEGRDQDAARQYGHERFFYKVHHKVVLLGVVAERSQASGGGGGGRGGAGGGARRVPGPVMCSPSCALSRNATSNLPYVKVILRTIETMLDVVQQRSAMRLEWYVLLLIVAELAVTVYSLLK